MKLSDLIKSCQGPGLKLGLKPDHPMRVNGGTKITGISTRAQDIRPGEVFMAVKGYAADGHDYIKTAIENGAAAVVGERIPDNLEPKDQDRIIRVEDSRKATAAMAAAFYGHPSKDLTLIGITGTNGKTTITYLLESILAAAGITCGVIGTINIRYGGKATDNPVTTPDAVVLQRSLAGMRQAGITHAIMEVSSHGLDQSRVDGCEFAAGIYTNLSQDHLDYHPDMDDYFRAKKHFFTGFLGTRGKNGSAPAIINIDDDYGQKLAGCLDCKVLTVSHSRAADITARNIIDTIRGLSGRIRIGDEAFQLTSELTGRFNLENILCAAGAAHAVGIPTERIRAGLEACTGVPGRLEKIPNTLNRYLFVDYAHTPDALGSILEALKSRAPKRLITVFGCGGDRDRTKRPLMGEIACRYSDVAIVTSDNPRTEDPDRIIDDAMEGVRASELPELDRDAPPGGRGYIRESNRRQALGLAVNISKPGDIIVAAGKGHETYQITNAGTIHFDDKEELINACGLFSQRFTPIPWTVADLSEALGADPVVCTLGSDTLFSGISTDSRTIRSHEVFLALTGENFDAHAFVPDLLAKGTRAVVADRGFFRTLDPSLVQAVRKVGVALFETPDTLAALGRLGRFQRLRAGVKVVAITGSSGKTTTRKMTRGIFEQAFETLATRGNFNNEIGVPQTLLKLSRSHEWAVIEMGMNHPGEMERLSAIALPDIALVTNTADVHLEGLKTVENVARAKAEIFGHVRENGTAVIFGDDPRQAILAEAARANPGIREILFFGSAPGADVSAEAIETIDGTSRFTAGMGKERIGLTIHSPARFMVNNGLAAVAAARAAGISFTDIQTGLAAFSPVSGRMTIRPLANGCMLIDDTYNANPASVAQALNTLAAQSTDSRAVAVLGDMLELGEASARFHWEIGKTAAELGINRLYLFGKESAHTRAGALENGMAQDSVHHGTKEDIAARVMDHVRPGDWILVKGSRGMAMETIISTWEDKETTGKGKKA